MNSDSLRSLSIVDSTRARGLGGKDSKVNEPNPHGLVANVKLINELGCKLIAGWNVRAQLAFNGGVHQVHRQEECGRETAAKALVWSIRSRVTTLRFVSRQADETGARQLVILPVEVWMDPRRYQPLREAGATWREIADEVGLDWRTVKKSLSTGSPAGPPAAPSRRGIVTRKIDAGAPVVEAWLAGDPRLKASVIHERLVAEHGFTGQLPAGQAVCGRGPSAAGPR